VRDVVDVVVVGGRVAGTLTALRLAARGVSVRLLEAHATGTDTLSTHFFRGDGLLWSLAEVGVLDEVLATGSPRLGGEYVSVDGGPLEQGPPQEPGEIGSARGSRRTPSGGVSAPTPGSPRRPRSPPTSAGSSTEWVAGKAALRTSYVLAVWTTEVDDLPHIVRRPGRTDDRGG
jgi:choline dehydrogenase-like flavoprotein